MSPTRLSRLARSLRPLLLVGLFWVIHPRTVGAPPGDDFANPIQVSGERWLQAISATNATAEPGEKSHYSASTYLSGNPKLVPVPPRSIWLNWNAPRSGVAQVLISRRAPLNPQLQRNELRPRLVIYLNPTNVSLAGRISGTRFGTSPQQLTRFPVTEGANYRFVFSSTLEWDGDYWVALTMDDTNAPPNDNFAQAQTLPVDQPAGTFSLEHATLENSELGFGFFKFVYSYYSMTFNAFLTDVSAVPRGGSSVWFRWVAPRNGGYSITTSAPGAIPQLAVWRLNGTQIQTVSNLAPVVRIENGGNQIRGNAYSYWADPWYSETATAAIRAQAGDEFWLQVDRVSIAPDPLWQIFPSIDPYPQNEALINALTNHTLGVISISSTAPNDSFAAAVPVTLAATDTLSNSGATLEPGEPLMTGLTDAHGSFWWTWTAPNTGVFLVENLEADAFRGEFLPSLQLLNTDAVRSNQFFGTFTATAGETLHIRSLVTPSDTYRLVDPVPRILGAAINDDFQQAIAVTESGDYLSLSQLAGTLTQESGEMDAPDLGNSGSAWFKVPARGDRKVVVSPELISQSSPSSAAHQILRFFVGSDLASLVEISPETTADFGAIFKLAGGQQYYAQLQRNVTQWRSPYYGSLRVLPRHDQFANRLPVTGNSLYFGYYSDGPMLSAEPGEPQHAGLPARHSLWFEWTPSATGPLLGDFTAPPGSRLAIYRGSELHSLQPVAAVISSIANQAVRFHLAVTNREKLQLALESDSAPGSVSFQRALDHDSLDTPWEFLGSVAGLVGSPASTDAQERLLIPDASLGVVWHRWIAPAAGNYSLEIMLTGVRPRADLILPRVAIFSGPDRSQLSPVPTEALTQFTGRKLVSFQAEAGQTFYFGVIPQNYDLLRYDLGLLGTVPRSISLQLQFNRDPLVPADFSPNGRFVHRLERSGDLMNWEPVEWLDIYSNPLVTPAKHLYPTGNTFLRIVSPQ